MSVLSVNEEMRSAGREGGNGGVGVKGGCGIDICYGEWEGKEHIRISAETGDHEL